ncbi:hypothetical protein [Aeoliella sp. SH292]|uniref:hypothetical protein n=1 Tax=Aeoliella sp. SH292 TaxID=3454464 RepID=UPI003F94321F
MLASVNASANNTVLVADGGNSRVLSYNVDSNNDWSFNGVFAQPSDGSGLSAPGPILYDGASTVYVGETNNSGSARILKYSLSGAFQGVLTTFSGEVPDQLALAPDGNLLASNPFGNNGFEQDNIYKIDVATGSYSQFIAQPDPLFFPSSPYTLANPRGMAIKGNTLYVANRDGMGSSGGSILRFDATTGAYLDAGIGANPASINDDVFGDFDNAQALYYDAPSDTLYASVFGGGQDIFAIELAGSAAMAPPLSGTNTPEQGVTKVYNPSDTGFILDIAVVNGVTYWSSFNGSVERLDAVDTRTRVVSGLANGQGLQEIPFQGIGTGEIEWVAGGLGDWSVGANWVGGIPDGTLDRVLLGATIQTDSSIYSDVDRTVQSLRFDSPNTYAIVGAGELTLQSAVGDATIVVDDGDHELQLVMNLASDTNVTVAAGSTLAFNNLLNLNGFTLSILGAGTVDFNNALVTGGGSISASGSVSLLGAEGLGVVYAVPEPSGVFLLLVGSLVAGASYRSRQQTDAP